MAKYIQQENSEELTLVSRTKQRGELLKEQHEQQRLAEAQEAAQEAAKAGKADKTAATKTTSGVKDNAG